MSFLPVVCSPHRSPNDLFEMCLGSCHYYIRISSPCLEKSQSLHSSLDISTWRPRSDFFIFFQFSFPTLHSSNSGLLILLLVYAKCVPTSGIPLEYSFVRFLSLVISYRSPLRCPQWDPSSHAVIIIAPHSGILWPLYHALFFSGISTTTWHAQYLSICCLSPQLKHKFHELRDSDCSLQYPWHLKQWHIVVTK